MLEINSKFCFLSRYVLIFKIGWKFIRCKRVEWPKVLKRFVNFRPTVSRGWLLGLTSQEDGAEIICYYTLRLTTMINTVLKFPYSKCCFNWTNISSFLAEFLQWSVSPDAGGSPRGFVNKGPVGNLTVQRSAACTGWHGLSDLSYCNSVSALTIKSWLGAEELFLVSDLTLRLEYE